MASPILLRASGFDTPPMGITVDGRAAQLVRRHEHGGRPRGDFCLMGACQECRAWLGTGLRGSACATPVSEGMQVSTYPDPDLG